MLVVPMQDANTGALLQGVSGMEGAAEDFVDRGQKRDGGGRAAGRSGIYYRREVRQGGTGLPLHNRCREASPGPG